MIVRRASSRTADFIPTYAHLLMKKGTGIRCAYSAVPMLSSDDFEKLAGLAKDSPAGSFVGLLKKYQLFSSQDYQSLYAHFLELCKTHSKSGFIDVLTIQKDEAIKPLADKQKIILQNLEELAKCIKDRHAREKLLGRIQRCKSILNGGVISSQNIIGGLEVYLENVAVDVRKQIKILSDMLPVHRTRETTFLMEQLQGKLSPTSILKKLLTTSSLEHIVPWSKEGGSAQSNLLLVSSRLNNKRGCKPFGDFVAGLHGGAKNIRLQLGAFRRMGGDAEIYADEVGATVSREAPWIFV